MLGFQVKRWKHLFHYCYELFIFHLYLIRLEFLGWDLHSYRKKNSLKADNSTGKVICPTGRGSTLEAEQLQMDLITGSCYWSKKIMRFA